MLAFALGIDALCLQYACMRACMHADGYVRVHVHADMLVDVYVRA